MSVRQVALGPASAAHRLRRRRRGRGAAGPESAPPPPGWAAWVPWEYGGPGTPARTPGLRPLPPNSRSAHVHAARAPKDSARSPAAERRGRDNLQGNQQGTVGRYARRQLVGDTIQAGPREPPGGICTHPTVPSIAVDRQDFGICIAGQKGTRTPSSNRTFSISHTETAPTEHDSPHPGNCIPLPVSVPLLTDAACERKPTRFVLLHLADFTWTRVFQAKPHEAQERTHLHSSAQGAGSCWHTWAAEATGPAWPVSLATHRSREQTGRPVGDGCAPRSPALTVTASRLVPPLASLSSLQDGGRDTHRQGASGNVLGPLSTQVPAARCLGQGLRLTHHCVPRAVSPEPGLGQRMKYLKNE
ncbi:uncharacterized protein LOC110349553 [Heterocephalus glaber]|uniref:Uncharacterized protein LOC110349553 n=1 Tax=Heterocephalus glaber TaxID=10181 RepID=A0AAX6T4Z4_HETGA|nr:uncharacterized protein LOC110349553 [Heterocephalus glaber]